MLLKVYVSINQIYYIVQIISNNTVSKILPDGTVYLYASGLNGPTALSINSNNQLYITNYGGNFITKISENYSTTDFSYGLYQPTDILSIETNIVYYNANTGNNNILKISPTQTEIFCL